MNHTDESAIAALKRSRILIAIAICCCLAALGMGFAALNGAFQENKGLAAALMATFVMLALLLGAFGASQRSAARMKGWVPVKELDIEAVQARTRYLEAALGEKSKGVASQSEQAEPAAEETAKEQVRTEGAEPADKPAAKEDVAEDGAEPAAETSPKEDGAGPAAEESEIEAFKGASQQSPDMTDEEMLIAAAEALLAEAASGEGRPEDAAEENEQGMLSDEVFKQLAGMSPYMRTDDLDEGDDVKSTIRTRRIARERIATVDKMVARAEDVIAVSRDIANSQTQDPAFETLAALLRGNPILEMAEPPQVRPIKLTRNSRYWMSGPSANEPEEIFDALLSLEAAYNINQDVQSMMGRKPEMERKSDIRRRIIAVLTETSIRKLNTESKFDYLPCAYAGTPENEICSDWALRAGIATTAENAALPFRISFDMMTNAAEGVALILLEIPRPDCFRFVAQTEEERAEFARDYALRSAVFMARAAFGTKFGGSLKKAVVCCHPHGDPRTLLSVEATPESMPRLKSLTGYMAPIPEPVDCPAIRMSCENGWLDPVEPHLLPGNDALDPLRYIQLAEASTRKCGKLLAKATGAKLECDLGTRAEAPMEQAWLGLGNLGDTVESAVAAIMIISDEAESQDVRDGCDRVMRALVEGSVEPNRLDQLTRIFKGVDELEETLAFGLRAYTSQSPSDMERAISLLSAQLDPQTQISLLDDTEAVFRYFHSIPDRIHYNLTTDDPRKVSLVPHNYYSANEMAAYLLCQVGRPEEAEPFAREIRRIAPYAPASATILARVFERQERIMEAIELVNEAILHATTVHDAALCYYRMAYLQWRMGREDLANASYRLTVALHTEISKQARKELDELLASDDKLKELSPTGACKKLAEAGVRIWDLEGFRYKMAQAAILCADQQLYPAASQLTLSLLEFQKDDAITDVYRSFSV